MGTKALYAGSFDPVTCGHLDIVTRACGMFEHVVVGVGHNPKKPGLFTVDERIELLRSACKGLKNLSFESYSGLTVEFARQERCSVLVRGLRDTQDFAIEMQMAHMNDHLDSEIETIFVPCLQKYAGVSSSLMKEVASLGGEVSGLVPLAVEKALKKKFRTRRLEK
jgi:pantetheine-phosphate adenylyltransferase